MTLKCKCLWIRVFRNGVFGMSEIEYELVDLYDTSGSKLGYFEVAEELYRALLRFSSDFFYAHERVSLLSSSLINTLNGIVKYGVDNYTFEAQEKKVTLLKDQIIQNRKLFLKDSKELISYDRQSLLILDLSETWLAYLSNMSSIGEKFFRIHSNIIFQIYGDLHNYEETKNLIQIIRRPMQTKESRELYGRELALNKETTSITHHDFLELIDMFEAYASIEIYSIMRPKRIKGVKRMLDELELDLLVSGIK